MQSIRSSRPTDPRNQFHLALLIRVPFHTVPHAHHYRQVMKLLEANLVRNDDYRYLCEVHTGLCLDGHRDACPQRRLVQVLWEDEHVGIAPIGWE